MNIRHKFSFVSLSPSAVAERGQLIHALASQGLSNREISERLHCSYSKVRYWLRPERRKRRKGGPNYCRKITPEQRDELVKLFCVGGLEATAELTKRYGIDSRYPVKAASALGIKRPRWRGGAKFKPEKPRKFERGKEDPRWAVAIKRGAICI